MGKPNRRRSSSLASPFARSSLSRRQLASRTLQSIRRSKQPQPTKLEKEWRRWAPFTRCKIPSKRKQPETDAVVTEVPTDAYPWCIQCVEGAFYPDSHERWVKDLAKDYLAMPKPEDVGDDSKARLEWLELKKGGKTNAHLDAIMSVIGLEEIKEHFLLIWKRFFSTCTEKMIPPKFFNLVLKGGNKDSKQKIAYMYARLLHSLGVVEDERSEHSLYLQKEKDGMNALAKDAISAVIILILPEEEPLKKETDDSACQSGSAFLFTFATILLVPASYRRSFDNLRSLVVRNLDAKGLSFDPAEEQLAIACLARQASKVEAEETPFGDDGNNVIKVIEKACEKMKERNAPVELQWRREQARRHWEKATQQFDGKSLTTQQSRKSKTPFKAKPKPSSLLILEDVVGPLVPDLKAENKVLKQLQGMTGLDKIKEEFALMIDYAQRKKERERLGIDMPRTFSLHRLFLGPPGVGKTTVARLYGQLMIDLGLVSGTKGSWDEHEEPTVVNPSDLIGMYIGHSESETRSALSDAMGGVLIIDEAHMLYTSRVHGDSSDVFRIAVLDTIVAVVTADVDEDRCVILVGYPDRMEDMFLNSNPGLQRRFPKETAMRFDAYTADELLHIFNAKMGSEKIQATEDALKVVKQVLVRMRINPQFGNAGDVENLLATARRRHLADNPQSTWSSSSPKILELEPKDIDPRWDRLLSADGSRAALFERFVGFEGIANKFEQYKNTVVGMERRGLDPRPEMPWNFVFEGPPGTGKTSTARKLGQLYYDLCLLSTDDVIECSVGELLDMTGLKVTNMLERSLGKVLFIDEAYRMVGTTAGELITGELVDAVTKTRYARNLVIVLAGYTKDMDKLLDINPGLRSRFPERIQFPSLSGIARSCWRRSFVGKIWQWRAKRVLGSAEW